MPALVRFQQAPGDARGFLVSTVYAVTMADETPDDYPVSMRLMALVGLFVVGALAFILIDVASNGKITGGCADCQDKGDAGA